MCSVSHLLVAMPTLTHWCVCVCVWFVIAKEFCEGMLRFFHWEFQVVKILFTFFLTLNFIVFVSLLFPLSIFDSFHYACVDNVTL